MFDVELNTTAAFPFQRHSDTLELVFFSFILISYEPFHTMDQNTLASCLINPELITCLHLRRIFFSIFINILFY